MGNGGESRGNSHLICETGVWRIRKWLEAREGGIRDNRGPPFNEVWAVAGLRGWAAGKGERGERDKREGGKRFFRVFFIKSF